MVQRPKDSVRRAILAAAAQEFAEFGLTGATLGGIAARANTSTGNLYKYFANKEDVFHAAIPPEVASELSALLCRRVEALGDEREPRRLGRAHPYFTASRELLDFTLAHRAEVLFLLRHGEGTRYAGFGGEVVQGLTQLALAYAERAYPRIRVSASLRRALTRVYRGFLATMASILAEETTRHALEEATAHFTTYHLAGLRRLFAAAPRASAQGKGRR